jgi:hypothetical protein
MRAQSITASLRRSPVVAIAPKMYRNASGTTILAVDSGPSISRFSFLTLRVADIDDKASEIVLFVHWVGGVHSEMRLPRRRRGQRNSTSIDVIAAVRELVLIAKDDLIAGILNRNGFTTGHGNRWTGERAPRCARITAFPSTKRLTMESNPG